MAFTERKMQQFLAALLESSEAAEVAEEFVDGDAEAPEISVTSFRDAGVLTNNAGLVVRVGRREFQLTVVESTPSYLREPEEDPEACPGCGCRPGDGRTEGCKHPDGCGYWEED